MSYIVYQLYVYLCVLFYRTAAHHNYHLLPTPAPNIRSTRKYMSETVDHVIKPECVSEWLATRGPRHRGLLPSLRVIPLTQRKRHVEHTFTIAGEEFRGLPRAINVSAVICLVKFDLSLLSHERETRVSSRLTHTRDNIYTLSNRTTTTTTCYLSVQIVIIIYYLLSTCYVFLPSVHRSLES